MEYYLILARSVTFAQRIQKALASAGIRSQMFRAPREVTELGCAYGVHVAASDIRAAMKILRQTNLRPVQLFWYHHGNFQEVSHDLF